MMAYILALAAATVTPNQTVFGITLGEPISLPQCPPDSRVQTTCYQTPVTLRGETWKTSFVSFPPPKVPAIMASVTLAVRINDEHVIGMDFQTLGIEDQQDVIDGLTRKFGEPTHVTPKEVQNLSGATFEAVDAEWVLTDLSIRFDSVGYDLKGGRVTILNGEGLSLEREVAKRSADERTPL